MNKKRESLYRWRAHNQKRQRDLNRASWARATPERRKRRILRERKWRKEHRKEYLLRRYKYRQLPKVREHNAIYKKWRVWWVNQTDRQELAIDGILRDLSRNKITEKQAHTRIGFVHRGMTHMAYQQ